MNKMVLVLFCFVASRSFATTAVYAIQDASPEIQSVLRASSEAEIKNLGSNASQAAEVLKVLDGSLEPAQALARTTLQTYFASSPLVKSFDLLGKQETILICGANLETHGLAKKYDLDRTYRLWREATSGLFPPNKSAKDYHGVSSTPFTASKLVKAFNLAKSLDLKGEMITALQLMLVFENENELIESLAVLHSDELLFKVGVQLLANWYADPEITFDFTEFILPVTLKAFQYPMDSAVRARSEILFGDLIEEFLSPIFQHEIKKHFVGQRESKKFYLDYALFSLMNAVPSFGEVRYMFRDDHIVGQIKNLRVIRAVRRLTAFAEAHGMGHDSPVHIGALRAIGDREVLRSFANDFKSRKDFALARDYFAAAGDLTGVRRTMAVTENTSLQNLATHIESVINWLADDELILQFATNLAEVSDWSSEYAKRYYQRSRIKTYPAPRRESLQSLYQWSLDSDASPRRDRQLTSQTLMESAKSSLARGDDGVGDALRAAFKFADE